MVYCFFFLLIFTLKHNCGYSLEPPQRDSSNMNPQSIFVGKNLIIFHLNILFLKLSKLLHKAWVCFSNDQNFFFTFIMFMVHKLNMFKIYIFLFACLSFPPQVLHNNDVTCFANQLLWNLVLKIWTLEVEQI